MALSKSVLKTQLNNIFNDGDYPSSLNDSNIQWSDAIDAYAKTILPITTSSIAAKSAFLLTMSGISVSAKNGLIQLQLALQSYATVLAVGMQPTFTSTPPPILINLTPVSTLGLGGGSSTQCIELMCTLIDMWFRTGIAVNNSSSTTIIWN